MHSSPGETEQAFYDALEAGDLDALMALWADDEQIMCIHPGGPRLVGYESIRESWKEILASGTLRIRPMQVRAIEGMMVAIHNLQEQVLVSGSRSSQVVEVSATNVYLKGPQGWKMVLHHASPATETDENEEIDTSPTLH
ncbi:MAG: nuclear transport factor 2 family protein [Burkholderiales bacterium]|nr:nuclear transport factor 2 family protein [Burkholderiales bacterium]